ncbi:hypothetical protein Y032_0009g679 [Ancylostoma ceylanicum]|uniref:Uncharacterized protein n=1 Tax=Ancylostoma ceylanicum TaxID=53326 RepID=A0A016VJ92_9BILA|nr:hypothetical protein Y032_0009g679 [Ancylostoma ceylanicum]
MVATVSAGPSKKRLMVRARLPAYTHLAEAVSHVARKKKQGARKPYIFGAPCVLTATFAPSLVYSATIVGPPATTCYKPASAKTGRLRSRFKRSNV